MCDKDCLQNPYYQDLLAQKACSPNGLPSIDEAIYAETRKCAPCQNKVNWRSCGFPTWEQFDKVDCTFKGLNRTYGKLVPARLMTDVMLPGPPLRSKKSASDSRLRRVPCKKKGAGGLRGATSDTQVGGKSKSGKGKSINTGKGAGQSGKGGRKTGGHGGGGHGGGGRGGGGHGGVVHGGGGNGGGGNGGGGSVGQSGGKTSKYSKSRKGGKHQQEKEDYSSNSAQGNEVVTDSISGKEIDLRSKLGPDGEFYLDENSEKIFTQSLMNSGILTLTPLQERDGQYYFNFNVRNQKPNPDLNLNINVQNGIFLGENKLTTEIRYRLEHTFDEALKNN